MEKSWPPDTKMQQQPSATRSVPSWVRGRFEVSYTITQEAVAIELVPFPVLLTEFKRSNSAGNSATNKKCFLYFAGRTEFFTDVQVLDYTGYDCACIDPPTWGYNKEPGFERDATLNSSSRDHGALGAAFGRAVEYYIRNNTYDSYVLLGFSLGGFNVLNMLDVFIFQNATKSKIERAALVSPFSVFYPAETTWYNMLLYHASRCLWLLGAPLPGITTKTAWGGNNVVTTALAFFGFHLISAKEYPYHALTPSHNKFNPGNILDLGAVARAWHPTRIAAHGISIHAAFPLESGVDSLSHNKDDTFCVDRSCAFVSKFAHDVERFSTGHSMLKELRCDGDDVTFEDVVDFLIGPSRVTSRSSYRASEKS